MPDLLFFSRAVLRQTENACATRWRSAATVRSSTRRLSIFGCICTGKPRLDCGSDAEDHRQVRPDLRGTSGINADRAYRGHRLDEIACCLVRLYYSQKVFHVWRPRPQGRSSRRSAGIYRRGTVWRPTRTFFGCVYAPARPVTTSARRAGRRLIENKSLPSVTRRAI